MICPIYAETENKIHGMYHSFYVGKYLVKYQLPLVNVCNDTPPQDITTVQKLLAFCQVQYDNRQFLNEVTYHTENLPI